jgi:hypothetical protein
MLSSCLTSVVRGTLVLWTLLVQRTFDQTLAVSGRLSWLVLVHCCSVGPYLCSLIFSPTVTGHTHTSPLQCSCLECSAVVVTCMHQQLSPSQPSQGGALSIAVLLLLCELGASSSASYDLLSACGTVSHSPDRVLSCRDPKGKPGKALNCSDSR